MLLGRRGNFFIQLNTLYPEEGNWLLGTGIQEVTLQELLDFLEDQGVTPSQVRIRPNFSTYARDRSPE